MLKSGRKLVLSFSVCATCLMGCSHERLDRMAGRVDFAEGQMSQLIAKGEKSRRQKNSKLQGIRQQLEQDAERTKQQQENALRNIEDLQRAMSGEQVAVKPKNPQPLIIEPAETFKVVPLIPDKTTSQNNVMLADTNPQFQSAYADYSRGRYNLAIEGFENLRQSHKQGLPRARVEYFLGECYYNKLEFAKALTHFAAVGKFATNEGLLAPSLWKRAMSYDRLNLPARSNEALQELVKRFPNSEEAGLANERLTGNAP